MKDRVCYFCGAPYPCEYHPPGECKEPKVVKKVVEKKSIDVKTSKKKEK